MKNHRNELDVDIIGGDRTLTKEEELAISAYIRRKKKKTSKLKVRRAKPSKANRPLVKY